MPLGSVRKSQSEKENGKSVRHEAEPRGLIKDFHPVVIGCNCRSLEEAREMERGKVSGEAIGVRTTRLIIMGGVSFFKHSGAL